jgi:hypothetical protein
MAVYRRGKTWWFKFKFRGLEIRESAHTGSRTTALKAERARRNQLDEGASAIKTVKPLLFSKAAKDWLTLKEVHWTASTRRAEGYNVDHLLPHFGTRLLTDITAEAVNALSSRSQERRGIRPNDQHGDWHATRRSAQAQALGQPSNPM